MLHVDLLQAFEEARKLVVVLFRFVLNLRWLSNEVFEPCLLTHLFFLLVLAFFGLRHLLSGLPETNSLSHYLF